MYANSPETLPVTTLRQERLQSRSEFRRIQRSVAGLPRPRHRKKIPDRRTRRATAKTPLSDRVPAPAVAIVRGSVLLHIARAASHRVVIPQKDFGTMHSDPEPSETTPC